jgi:HTH-type transcriptional regulator / antitoxin HigA
VLVLIKDYADKCIAVLQVDAIEVVQLKMKERGMKAKDLEPLPGTTGHNWSIYEAEEN